MKITLRKTTYLSLDGVHTNKYEAGKVYEATSAHARRIFDTLVANGQADKADAQPTEEGTDTAKVRTKRETK
jgi:hypothetical protein